MKQLLLALSLCAFGASAGEPIVTTIITRSTLGTNFIYALPESVPVYAWLGETNVVDIPNGQAARVASTWPIESTVQVIKNGLVWPVMKGDVIQGPARFTLARGTIPAAGEIAVGHPAVPSPEPQMLTLERWTVRKATPAQLAQ